MFLVRVCYSKHDIVSLLWIFLKHNILETEPVFLIRYKSSYIVGLLKNIIVLRVAVCKSPADCDWSEAGCFQGPVDCSWSEVAVSKGSSE